LQVISLQQGDTAESIKKIFKLEIYFTLQLYIPSVLKSYSNRIR